MPGTPLPRFEAAFESLKATLRLAVIYGGDKRQPGAVLQPTLNTRPWKSYEAVATTIAGVLAGMGFVHVTLMSDDLHLAERLREERIDLAWLNTGGVQGRDPMAHAPALLELAGIPYVGHDPLNVSRLDNKHVFKRELAYLGIDTAPFLSWSPDDGPLDVEDARFRAAFGDVDGAFVVKPVSGRASLGVSLAENPHELAEQVAALLLNTRNPVLIERYLPGREFCVAVCGGLVSRAGRFERLGEPFAFSVVERVFEPDERICTSMDHKAITVDRARP
ncbi:MAG TPA: D-alanyl-alanine synthetase, partial [Oscillatoriaceae cyanobacterium]